MRIVYSYTTYCEQIPFSAVNVHKSAQYEYYVVWLWVSLYCVAHQKMITARLVFVLKSSPLNL